MKSLQFAIRLGPALLLMIIEALGLSGCGDSMASQPTSMSFEDFRKQQEDYCDAVAAFLNTPIDWHIVVDISGSYLPKEETTPKALVPLVRSLPLQQGDLLTMDTFGESYYEGRHLSLTADWIKAIKNSESTAKNEIENSLVPLEHKLGLARQTTDIAELFISSPPKIDSHTFCEQLGTKPCDPHGKECSKFNKYYVLLTDGMHEPQGEGKIAPLFRNPQGKDTGFANFLFQFAHRKKGSPFRALFIVIDSKAIKNPQTRTRVLDDWLYGFKLIAERRNAARQQLSQPPPLVHGILWNPSDPNLITPEIQKQIGRAYGVYPCLVSSTDPTNKTSQSLPTATGFTYELQDKLEGTIQDIAQHPLQIPDDVIIDEADHATLPLEFLITRGETKDLSVTARGKRLDSHTDSVIYGPEIQTLHFNYGESFSGWKTVLRSIPITLTDRKIERFGSTWTIQMQFDDQQSRQPFLSLKLTQPTAGMKASLITGSAEDTGIRGRHAAVLAIISYLASTICVILYIFRVRVQIEVSGNEGIQSKSTQEPLYGKRHFRFCYDNEIIAPVPRQHGPDEDRLKADMVEIDVVPTLNVVYHIVYYRDEKPRRLGDPKTSSQLAFGNLVWLFYWPATFWKPAWKPASTDADKRVLIEYRWTSLVQALIVHPPTSSNAATNSPAVSEFKIITKLREGFLLFFVRACATICACLSFAWALRAICESFGWHHTHEKIFWVTFALALAACCLAFVTSFYTNPGKLRLWLHLDAVRVALLNITLALALFLSFVAKSFFLRWTSCLAAIIIFLFGLLFYQSLRDSFVQARIENKKPAGIGDFLAEVLFAYLGP